MLLVVLAGDQCRDVELQPVQIEAKAAARNFRLHSGAEIVNVELGSLLGITGLYVYMLDGIGHGRSPSCGSSIRGEPRGRDRQNARYRDRLWCAIPSSGPRLDICAGAHL